MDTTPLRRDDTPRARRVPARSDAVGSALTRSRANMPPRRRGTSAKPPGSGQVDGRVVRDDSVTMRQRSERSLLAEFPVPDDGDDDDDDDDDANEEEDAAVAKRPPALAMSGAKRTRATARRSAPDRIARGREKQRVEPEEPAPGEAANAEREGDLETPNGSFEGDGSRRESPAGANAARSDRDVVMRRSSIIREHPASSFRVFSDGNHSHRARAADARASVPTAEPEASAPALPSRVSSKRRRIATTAHRGTAWGLGLRKMLAAVPLSAPLSALTGKRSGAEQNGADSRRMAITEEDRLPPLRPKARLGGPRGRQLWHKVRLNKDLLIGEGVGTGASSYWRRRAGVGAFLFSVDKDVNGRKKNRGLALRKAAKATSRRTRFPEDEAFARELESLRDLSRAETHALCKSRGLRVRDGLDRSVAIDADVLKARLLHHAHGNYGNDWFEPSPFGRNKRGYYAPLALAFAQCALVSGVTLGGTYFTYACAERWHASQNCHKIWNWMNPQCQAADFLRTHAKQAVYRWYYQVGSVVALRAGAWVDAVSKEAGRLATEATEGLASKMELEPRDSGEASRDGRRSRGGRSDGQGRRG